MPTKHHWIISDRAANDLLRITGRSREPFSVAFAELRSYATQVIEAGKEPRVLASGYHQFRTGRPLRARLIVNPNVMPPELVEVLPDHAERAAPYMRAGVSGVSRRARLLAAKAR